MKTANKILTLTATVLTLLPTLLSCNGKNDIGERQMEGTFQFGIFGEKSANSPKYRTDAFTLMPYGKMLFHSITIQSVFGKFIKERHKKQYEELKRLTTEEGSLNGVQGKWEIHNYAESSQKYVSFYIDVSTVKNVKLKTILQKYARNDYYYIDGGFDLSYSNPYLIFTDKSVIVIMTYAADPDNLLPEFFIKNKLLN